MCNVIEIFQVFSPIFHVVTSCVVSLAGSAAGPAEPYPRHGARVDGTTISSHRDHLTAEESLLAGETRLPGKRRQTDQRDVQASQSGILKM